MRDAFINAVVRRRAELRDALAAGEALLSVILHPSGDRSSVGSPSSPRSAGIDRPREAAQEEINESLEQRRGWTGSASAPDAHPNLNGDSANDLLRPKSLVVDVSYSESGEVSGILESAPSPTSPDDAFLRDQFPEYFLS